MYIRNCLQPRESAYMCITLYMDIVSGLVLGCAPLLFLGTQDGPEFFLPSLQFYHNHIFRRFTTMCDASTPAMKKKGVASILVWSGFWGEWTCSSEDISFPLFE